MIAAAAPVHAMSAHAAEEVPTYTCQKLLRNNVNSYLCKGVKCQGSHGTTTTPGDIKGTFHQSGSGTQVTC